MMGGRVDGLRCLEVGCCRRVGRWYASGDVATFGAGLEAEGFEIVASRDIGGVIGAFVARRPG
jgi:hypothetical protein